MLAYIFWNPDPVAFSLFGFDVRWYGMCWGLAFLSGYMMMSWLYKNQKIGKDKFDPLFFYIFIGVLVGARLGHCLFYEPGYWITHPVEMLLPIKKDAAGAWHVVGYEGLASHGGVLGMMAAVIIAWLRIGRDGRLWAMNPENGFFGVAPGTNEKSNPNALATTREGAIFTNVCHNLDNNTVWWEGLDNDPPKNAVNWKGEKWDYRKYDKADKINTSGAHPNSRFTAIATNCPCLSSEFNNPAGVPVSAIIFGGRRAKTAPLVYQSTSWQNGTFVGSIMASETTAAAAGAIGVVRRDPMAMRPFVGYNMGDYWQHWLDMGKVIPNPPKIFHVNWFRTDSDGNFIWPGFGDNLRVVEWILKRCAGEIDADLSPIGYLPKPEDINIEGLDIGTDTVKELLSVDRASWLEDIGNIRDFYALVGDRVPAELHKELNQLEARLKKD